MCSKEVAKLAVHVGTRPHKNMACKRSPFSGSLDWQMTDAELALASPAEESPWGSTDDACKAQHFKARILNRTGEGATQVTIYLSMHIIACMTRQALNQLITTMQAAQEVRFIRACASQMAGRLLCEFEAPDRIRCCGFWTSTTSPMIGLFGRN